MYKSKRDLRLHRMIHSSFRPHKCTDCGKTFLSTSKLKQHLNIHTGSRPYKCKYCSKDFTNFPNWLKHTRRRHKVDHKTGEKLVEMPQFLKSKPNKKATEKKAAKAEAQNSNKGVEPKPLAAISNEKIETPLKIVSICSLKETEVNGGTQQSVTMVADELTSTLDDLMTYPLATQKAIPKTDLTTITVNDKTLPLNNADDLERAASLLMQQTLDIEDEVEFHSVKCENIDDLYADDQYYFQTIDNTALTTVTQENMFNRYEPSIGILGNDLVTYYYDGPALQCNLQPALPPINTVKCRIGQDASHTFASKSNVMCLENW